MLLAAALAHAEQTSNLEPLTSNPALTFAHAAFTLLGVTIAAALAYGLWVSRHLAALPDVGALLAHRGVGDYTLSMSSLFDLTGPSFAALRLPAGLALAAFAIGPAAAWILRTQRRHLAATSAIALHLGGLPGCRAHRLRALCPRCSRRRTLPSASSSSRPAAPSRATTPCCSSAIRPTAPRSPSTSTVRSISPRFLVDGRSSSMLFGSTFPDAQGLFLTPADLLAEWGSRPRKLLRAAGAPRRCGPAARRATGRPAGNRRQGSHHGPSFGLRFGRGAVG